MKLDPKPDDGLLEYLRDRVRQLEAKSRVRTEREKLKTSDGDEGDIRAMMVKGKPYLAVRMNKKWYYFQGVENV